MFNYLVLFFCLFPLLLFAAPQVSPLSLVDPLIGTAKSTTPESLKHSELANEGYAQTMPAVTSPFGMTNWTPQTRATEEKCLPPYFYDDTKIQGFRASHWMSGSCTQDYGSFTIMPMTGSLKGLPDSRASSFSHDTETSTPAYYKVTLDDYDIDVEMTASPRAAMLRFTFHKEDSAYILLQSNSDEAEGTVMSNAEKGYFEAANPAHRIYQGWDQSAGFSGHIVAESSRPFDRVGVMQGDEDFPGLTTLSNQADISAYGVLKVSPGDTLLIRLGTSFTSADKASLNLQTEIPHWNFKLLRQQLEADWNEMLGRVAVEGGSEAQQTAFYTAMYHSLLLPRRFNDVDGSYVGFGGENEVHKLEDGDYYVDFSMWDTFRCIHPLFNLICPEKSSDMMRSLVLKAQQGEWLPIFPAWNQYTAAMIGDHVIATLGDAYVKGIRGWDPEAAYPYLRKNAFESPKTEQEYLDGKGRRALKSYLQYGYVPLEDPVNEAFHKREQVSRTLEYAYDDFVLSRIAKGLGKQDDAAQLSGRALNYKNVFDPSRGYVAGRHADGTWTSEFVLTERMPYITEGTPQHYTWYVPHDVSGLMDLMGGANVFESKLDSLFDDGQYWHGNEPCHQISYLYNFAGAPHKTQSRVRHIMAGEYGTGPGGLSGNDDAGQMSAWFVFSAMGFYPVCPGVPEYVLGSTLFDKVSLRVPGQKEFTLQARNNSDDRPYIQSANWNGESFDKTYLSHHRIREGGSLILEMGPQPSDWGHSVNAAPYSLSNE